MCTLSVFKLYVQVRKGSLPKKEIAGEIILKKVCLVHSFLSRGFSVGRRANIETGIWGVFLDAGSTVVVSPSLIRRPLRGEQERVVISKTTREEGLPQDRIVASKTFKNTSSLRQNRRQREYKRRTSASRDQHLLKEDIFERMSKEGRKGQQFSRKDAWDAPFGNRNNSFDQNRKAQGTLEASESRSSQDPPLLDELSGRQPKEEGKDSVVSVPLSKRRPLSIVWRDMGRSIPVVTLVLFGSSVGEFRAR